MTRSEEYEKRIKEIKANIEQVKVDITKSPDAFVVSELNKALIVLKEDVKIMEESYADYKKRIVDKKPKKEVKKDDKKESNKGSNKGSKAKGSKAKGKLLGKKKS